MIVVTGANGNLGRAIVTELSKILPADESLAVSVRDPAKAAAYQAQGIDVRVGDFGDKASMVKAFAGATRAFIVSGDAPNEARIKQHRNAVDAAREAGVRHIVYASFVDHDANSPFPFAAVHHDTEAYLARTGVPYTVLRNGPYADLLPWFAGDVMGSGILALPAGTGAAAFLSRDDIARATAVVLASDKYVGKTLLLTGEKAVSYADVAAALSAQLGRAIRYQASDAQSYLAALKASGLPEYMADAIVGIQLSIAEGRFAPTSTTVRDITGKSPQDIDALLRQLFPTAASKSAAA
jgi:NAD(P)H dehydrogenase (quinone)